MARIRADYVFGTTTAAIDADDTTLSSAELSRLPAVSAPDVAAITLHDGTNYEIVHVTAHTASATTATILRGQEGSTAAAWDSGTDWLNGLTVDDAEEFASAGGGTPAYVGARVYATAAQTSSAAGAWEDVIFGAETFDTNGFHSTVTNPARLTIPSGMGGKYHVETIISYGKNVTGDRFISILKNGVDRYATNNVRAASNVNFRTRALTGDTIDLAAGDYITVQAYQNSGAGLEIGNTTDGGAVGETWCCITYRGA